MDTQQISDLNPNQNEAVIVQPDNQSLISEEIVDDEKSTRSVGICTDTSDLAPCEPGTNILLEGIVWNETSKGVLIVNVSWRGRTFVGSLIDAEKTSWAPPRFKDIPKFKQNKEVYPFFNQYGSNSLYPSSETPFNPFVSQPNQNGLSTDPTVRTLRNGKRRYINQYESDLMSDIEFDICNTNGVPGQQSTTPVSAKDSKIKESHSSASSVNEEEFDAMTQSSTASSTSSKCSNKSAGKKAKLNNGDAKSTASNSSARSYKKNKKHNPDLTLNSSNLDDTLSSSMVQGRHTPVNSESSEPAAPSNLNSQELKT